MERLRVQYYKEIDIVEHIMQFREVRAYLETKLNKNELQKSKTQLIFKRSRTRVLEEVDDSNGDEGTKRI